MSTTSRSSSAKLAFLLALCPVGDGSTATPLENARLNTPRAGHQATLLGSGHVLVTGGCAGASCQQVQDTSESYDPSRNRFTEGPNMRDPRVSHTATALDDGHVLIAGGWTGSSALPSTEIYEPSTGRFTSGPRMSVARMDGTATLLEDGEVLIVGGAHQTIQPSAAVERFDPSSGSLYATGNLQIARAHHAAVRLRDGRVLVVGGLVGRNTVAATAEIYDPKTGEFRQTGALSEPRCKHAAVLLADGRVMVLAGSRDCDGRQRLATTEIFDPITEKFIQGPRLSDPRYKIASAAVRLPSGAVLIAGGSSDIEVWNPGSPAFVPVAESLGTELAFSTVTALRNGRVLVIGGYDRTITPTDRTWQVARFAPRER